MEQPKITWTTSDGKEKTYKEDELTPVQRAKVNKLVTIRNEIEALDARLVDLRVLENFWLSETGKEFEEQDDPEKNGEMDADKEMPEKS